jgi:hypothetical protein
MENSSGFENFEKISNTTHNATNSLLSNLIQTQKSRNFEHSEQKGTISAKQHLFNQL